MAKRITKKEKEELKDLLLTETNRDEDSGLLVIAKRTLASDLHQDKIGRAIALVKKI